MTMYKHLQQQALNPTTIATLRQMKADRQPIACLTAYDASFAALLDAAGTDVVLVGDSLGMVIQGHDTTVPVSMEDMLYHTRCVSRTLRRAFLVADMPFGAYALPEQAYNNAARLMQDGYAQMVKLEGGTLQLKTVEFLARREIPVCAHIGLTPQSVQKIGGVRVQGREDESAAHRSPEAKSLAAAGGDSVRVVCVAS